MTIEFEPWPKIARLNRDIVITEKIDGTNAAILIVPVDQMEFGVADGGPDGNGGVEIRERRFLVEDQRNMIELVHGDGVTYAVFAQSRTRFIVPNSYEAGRDNYGFAQWVSENATALVETLGAGRHFGEWWGQGIQRGYGLDHKRFSLFNTSRWKDVQFEVPGLGVVPVLYWGPQSEAEVQGQLSNLQRYGSVAAGRLGVDGWEAEGIVIWHTAGRTFSKVTLKGDDAPKGPAAHANDEETPSA